MPEDFPLLSAQELERCEIPQEFPGHHVVVGFRAGTGWILRPKHNSICDLDEAREMAEGMKSMGYTSIRIYLIPADE